jgi:hypothetical protein
MGVGKRSKVGSKADIMRGVAVASCEGDFSKWVSLLEYE